MGAAGIFTRTDLFMAELRGLAVKSVDGARTRHLLAIALILEGRSRRDAARKMGMDRQTLCS